jgi:hypothetical protein
MAQLYLSASLGPTGFACKGPSADRYLNSTASARHKRVGWGARGLSGSTGLIRNFRKSIDELLEGCPPKSAHPIVASERPCRASRETCSSRSRWAAPSSEGSGGGFQRRRRASRSETVSSLPIRSSRVARAGARELTAGGPAGRIYASGTSPASPSWRRSAAAFCDTGWRLGGARKSRGFIDVSRFEYGDAGVRRLSGISTSSANIGFNLSTILDACSLNISRPGGLLMSRAASAQRMGAAGAPDRPDANGRRPDSCTGSRLHGSRSLPK